MHILTYTIFQNVVVVSQPSTLAHTTIIQPRPRANEYLILTVVLMVLCFIHGNLLAFFCLVPALICSYVVSKLFLCCRQWGNYTAQSDITTIAIELSGACYIILL